MGFVVVKCIQKLNLTKKPYIVELYRFKGLLSVIYVGSWLNGSNVYITLSLMDVFSVFLFPWEIAWYYRTLALNHNYISPSTHRKNYTLPTQQN